MDAPQEQFAKTFLSEASLAIEFAGIWHAPSDAPQPGPQFGIVKTTEYWKHLMPSPVAQDKMTHFIKSLRTFLSRDIIKERAIVLPDGLACLGLCNDSIAVLAPYFKDTETIAFTKGPRIVTTGGVEIIDEYPLRCFSGAGKLLGRIHYWNRGQSVIKRFAKAITAFSELKEFNGVNIATSVHAIEV